MFLQSSWQVAVSVNKADIEISIFQIPRLWVWTTAGAVAAENIMHLSVSFDSQVCCFRQEV